MQFKMARVYTRYKLLYYYTRTRNILQYYNVVQTSDRLKYNITTIRRPLLVNRVKLL